MSPLELKISTALEVPELRRVRLRCITRLCNPVENPEVAPKSSLPPAKKTSPGK
jgi:hypothetical protein